MKRNHELLIGAALIVIFLLLIVQGADVEGAGFIFQVLKLPFVLIVLGVGIDFLTGKWRKQNPYFLIPMVIISILLSIFFGVLR